MNECKLDSCSNPTKTKFCSASCAGRYAHRDRAPKPTANCLDCDAETTNPKFCSSSCAAKYNNRKHPKRKPEGFCERCLSPLITSRIICTECSETLTRELNSAKRNLEDSAAHPARKGGFNNYCTVEYSSCQVCGSVFANHDGSGKNKGKLKTCTTHRTRSGAPIKKAAHIHRKNKKIESWLSGQWSGATKSGDLSKIIWNFLRERANNICENADCISGGKPVPTHPSDGRTVLEVNHVNGNGQDHRPENLEVICPTCHALTPTYRGRNAGNGRPVSYIRKRK